MRRAVWVICFLASCKVPSPMARDAMPPKLFVHSPLGLTVTVPNTWIGRQEGKATVYSGPEHTPAYFTTLVLQSRDGGDDPPAALEGEAQRLTSLPGYALQGPVPLWIGTDLGLFYCAAFEWQEMPRRRCGVVFGAADAVVDLSLNAPAAQFDAALPVLVDALDGLYK